jgi:hypothetical protein
VLDDGAVEQAERRLTRQQMVVLHGPADRAAGQGQPVLAMLAQGTARLAEARAFDALVITGGDRRQAGCRRTVHAAGGRRR